MPFTSVLQFDRKNRRTFLKRTKYPQLKPSDLFVGNTVTVYSRQLRLVDFGDDFTRRALAEAKTRTVGLVLPEAYEVFGKVVSAVGELGLTVTRVRMVQLSASQAAELTSQSPDSDAVLQMASSPSLALELIGRNSVEEWLKVASTGLSVAGPGSLWGSSSSETVEADADFLFSHKAIACTAQLKQCTVCVVKPHAFTAGHTGGIIDAILSEGFMISALESFVLDRRAASEFLEVYNTVVPEYHALVDELASGTCVAMEIVSNDANLVEIFRSDIAGPRDPEVARLIRKNSIRAKFGEDKVKNAVHCTDLPDDGPLESEYFFSILQS